MANCYQPKREQAKKVWEHFKPQLNSGHENEVLGPMNEAVLTHPFICLSCKMNMIRILLIWRCHGVKTCPHEERTARAISSCHAFLLYATLGT